jgi:hypothetical protein
MSARFVYADQSTPLLFPENLREWLPENRPVHFTVEAAGHLKIKGYRVNETGSGRKSAGQ